MKKKKIQGTTFVKCKCFKCGREIDELNDNFLKMTSYNDGEIIEEVWFCLPKCWRDYNSDRMNARLAEMSKMGYGILQNMGMRF